MLKYPLSIAAARDHLRRSLSHLTSGGDWALTLPEKERQNLHWFWYDGLFAAACDNIVVTYLVLYVLALGATRAQIGLMSSLSSLMAALMLLPGALLVERIGHRKQITLIGGGGMGRLMLLLAASLPFVLRGDALIYMAIAFSVVRDAFGNLSFPAWMSIVGDIVPLSGRGRYFASRNFVMGIAGMITTLAVGEIITRTDKPGGYQIALGLAFALGLVSMYSFARLRISSKRPLVQAGPQLGFLALLRDLRTHS
ncbi:MAG: MFS transporter, partial [Anaerolineae bacterium]|nr:MFS transporter [Anaerolineae bacterium]